MCCRFTSNFILGLFNFERITPKRPVRCTMMCAIYQNILSNMCPLVPGLQQRNCVKTTVFFAGRGTTAHCSPSSMSTLWNLHKWTHYLQKFSKSLAFKISWPKSMWLLAVRKLEGTCLKKHVWSLVDPNMSIQWHLAKIPRELQWATVDHAIWQMHHVVKASGAHIENIL